VAQRQQKIIFGAGLPTAMAKKSQKGHNFYEKPRSRPYLTFFGKNTALRARITPNSGMGNPNLRKEFFLRQYIC
jgi:hypothetical protein